MKSADHPPPAPFGEPLGYAPGGVPAYSSDYDTADNEALPDRHAYRNYVDGIYMGHKWQCVEFARRWMYHERGLLFDDVAMAYEIFELRSVRVVGSDERLPLRAFSNGSRRPPEPGALLIWDEGGEFERTGHVAVITEVRDDHLRIAEQNLDHRPWPNGRNYSRELRARRSPTGEYWLECSFGDATILGWVIQTDDDTHAEPDNSADPRLFALDLRAAPHPEHAGEAWLNVANADEQAYVEMMGGHLLTHDPVNETRFLCMSATAEEAIERATNELHAMFMHATDFVLRNEGLLSRFGIPGILWPRIQASWNNRRNQMITGRFDFAMSERGIKVYEYNCDSASCHMECGKVQARWARHFGVRSGRDAGAALHARLRDAWRDSEVDGLVHILLDDDPEERYHALFMQEAMQEADIESRLVTDLDTLHWDEAGNLRDTDGNPVRWVWKTWAWETALDQLRTECESDAADLANVRPGEPRAGGPRLVDVLLRKEVMVFEPLWTLIPSNKAILPVLWSLFPNQLNLLGTYFELSDDLRARGYVEKPIVGRGGSNIRVVDGDETVLEATEGQFDHRDVIYQELFPLPAIDGYHVQVAAFSVAGMYAGSCVRADRAVVINRDSDTMALRVVDDEAMPPS